MKLSVCIPTYNFGRYIGETLQSILEQDSAEKIEVVVVDGASTDNTAVVVTELQKQYPQIKYIRLPAKGGIDRDMAKSVELASGDYCWLFSSDDTMQHGALRAILDQIDHGFDLYLCKDIGCTLDMKPRVERPVLRLEMETAFDLADPRERFRYFGLAENTVAFFSFMSVVVVRKTVWDSAAFNEAFDGSCWAHVGRLFEVMTKKGFTVKYLPKPYLNRRGDNDSFAGHGIVNRYRIAIDGYHRLAATFFGHRSIEAFHIRRAIRNEFGLKAFYIAKFRCQENPGTESKTLLDRLIRKVHGSVSPLSTLKYWVYRVCPAPGWLFFSLRRLYRALRYRNP